MMMMFITISARYGLSRRACLRPYLGAKPRLAAPPAPTLVARPDMQPHVLTLLGADARLCRTRSVLGFLD